MTKKKQTSAQRGQARYEKRKKVLEKLNDFAESKPDDYDIVMFRRKPSTDPSENNG